MAIRVKFLTEDEIEKDAELLLAEYNDTIGEPIKLPVPVDEIATYHLATLKRYRPTIDGFCFGSRWWSISTTCSDEAANVRFRDGANQGERYIGSTLKADKQIPTAVRSHFSSLVEMRTLFQTIKGAVVTSAFA